MPTFSMDENELALAIIRVCDGLGYEILEHLYDPEKYPFESGRCRCTADRDHCVSQFASCEGFHRLCDALNLSSEAKSYAIDNL